MTPSNSTPRPISVIGAIVASVTATWRGIGSMAIWASLVVAIFVIIYLLPEQEGGAWLLAFLAYSIVDIIYWIGCLRIVMNGETKLRLDDGAFWRAFYILFGLFFLSTTGQVVIFGYIWPIETWFLGFILTAVFFFTMYGIFLRITLAVVSIALGTKMTFTESWRIMRGQTLRLAASCLLLLGPIYFFNLFVVRELEPGHLSAALNLFTSLIDAPLSAGLAGYALRQRLGAPMRGLGET